MPTSSATESQDDCVGAAKIESGTQNSSNLAGLVSQNHVQAQFSGLMQNNQLDHFQCGKNSIMTHDWMKLNWSWCIRLLCCSRQKEVAGLSQPWKRHPVLRQLMVCPHEETTGLWGTIFWTSTEKSWKIRSYLFSLLSSLFSFFSLFLLLLLFCFFVCQCLFSLTVPCGWLHIGCVCSRKCFATFLGGTTKNPRPGSVDPQIISHVRPVEAERKVPPSQCIHVQDRDWFVISRSVLFSLI